MLSNLFKSKTTITLSEALELKEKIQDKLKVNQNILRNENVVLKNQKRNYNLKKVLKENEVLQERLVILKLLIQKANLSVLEGEKQCISHHVYTLSEKKNLIQNYESMQRETVEGDAREMGKKKVTEKELPVFSYTSLSDWLNQLKKDCFAIEASLTRLNKKVTVDVPFKTDFL
jgi:hypothetical protein